MKKLGLSIYPDKQSIKEMKEYLTLAAKYHFKRVFTSLLQINDKTKDKMLNDMKEICLFAQSLGYEVILDVAPNIFDKLGIKLPNVKFFKEIGANTLRLDVHYDGMLEANTCFNEDKIKLEINMSSFKHLIDLILEAGAPKDMVLASHNFYPQRNTGLDWKGFISKTKHYHQLGIRTSAFVTSQVGKIGPWPIMDGLCTLEQHRDLPIETQAKHLWATGMVDDIMIGNANASEQELKALSQLNPYVIELKVKLEKGISAIEKEILLNYHKHFQRGDANDYLIRSTMTRVIYKNSDFPKRNYNGKQNKGDVFIGNNTFGNYKGESQLVTKQLEHDDRKNLVAKVVKEEMFLLDEITPWKRFKFVEKK